MRHDPASGAIVIMLRSLKMYGMAQAVTDLIEQGAPAFEAAIPILSQLLKAELAEREVRSIAYHMKAARFPAYKDLSGFDFAASEINEATVRTLHRCEFMDGAQNIVLIGGPGTCSVPPKPDGFVTDLDAPPAEKVLGLAQRQRVSDVEHHRQADDFWAGLEIAKGARFGHSGRLGG